MQSAFDEHAVAAALLHVSQAHLSLVKPGALHAGLATLRTRD